MRKILVANRDEIARRVIATAERLGIATVAVHSDADREALHVHEAAQAVALGGSVAAESYLRSDKLLAAARATGADAVHPGYGFLSEDAAFAQTVQDAGLTWIGPPPAAMRALGSKAAARQLALRHGVPVLPGHAGDDPSDERLAAEAERIGYPVMVKAAAGGGGRGMRLVVEPGDLAQALKSARSEALAGFCNGELLIERALLRPRHVEVQILADAHGHAIHLGERDCSVQRRHQKIIEEAPSPALTPEWRARLGECALRLVQAAAYVGAGTVEFLLEGEQFYLMEVNTRLQVEHPVTEALTGLDLVEWQIRIARGEALPVAQQDVRLDGHAIEVRLCAEDADHVPHTGRILHFSAPAAAAFEPAPLRFDHAIECGMPVTPHYDAMLGKLVAHAPTRAEAIERLILALAQTEVLGVQTNRGFLMACLDDAVFRRGEARISFLAERGDALRRALLDEEQVAHERHALAALLPANRAGLACGFAMPLRLSHRARVLAVSVEARPGGYIVQGDPVREMELQPFADGSVGSREAGVSERVRGVVVPGGDAGERWHAQAGGVDWWFDDVSFVPAAGAAAPDADRELRAPFNGRVLLVAVQAGQVLAAGETAIVLESMKLEHSLAPRAAASVAEVRVHEGQQVSPGQVLLRLEPQPGAAG